MQPKQFLNPKTTLWFGALCTSFAATFIIASGEPPFVVTFYRLLFAVVFLLPVLLTPARRRQLRAITAADLTYCLLIGLSFGLHMTTYIASLRYTSVASAGALASLQPIFVAIGSYLFLRERIGMRVKLGIVCALVGGAIVGGGDLLTVKGLTLQGDLLALISGLMISLYFVAGRALRQRMDILPYLFIVYSSSLVVVAIMCLTLRVPLVPGRPANLLFLVNLGLISTTIGHGVFNWSLKYVNASTVSLAMLASPVLETFWVFAFLGQVPALTSIIGGVIVITGTTLAMSEKQTPDTPASVAQ